MPVMLDDIGEPARIGRNHRDGGAHGLEHRHAQTLAPGRMHQQVQSRDELRQIVPESHQLYPIAESPFADLPLQRLLQPAAPKTEHVHVRVTREYLGQATQKQRVALAGDQLSDHPHQDRPGRQLENRGHAFAGGGGGLGPIPSGIHGAGHPHHARGVQADAVDQFRLHRG